MNETGNGRLLMRKCLSYVAFAVSAMLAAVFLWLLRRDYVETYPFGSAPFYLYVAVRAAETLLPSAVCLWIGFILRKRK